MALALAILVFSGVALYVGREALQRTFQRISTGVQAGIERHFPGMPDGSDLLRRLTEMWPGEKHSAASMPAKRKGRDATGQQEMSGNFLYTVELLDGGKVEGKTVEIGKGVITVTDDQGLVLRINRNRVHRISKIPR